MEDNKAKENIDKASQENSLDSFKGLGISSLIGDRKKTVSPWMSMGFSLFIYPGSGQMMNRRLGKAAGFIISFTAFAGIFAYYFIKGILLILVPELQEAPPADSGTLWGLNPFLSSSVYWGALALLSYIWSAFDAYLDSRRLGSDAEKLKD